MRRQEVQRRAVGVKLLRPALGEIGQRLPRFLRIADRLVIHIRDVAHMQRRRAGSLHHAAHHILRHEGAEVADVRRAIDRGSAAVETQRLAIQRRGFAIGAGQGVVELQGRHGGVENEW